LIDPFHGDPHPDEGERDADEQSPVLRTADPSPPRDGAVWLLALLIPSGEYQLDESGAPILIFAVVALPLAFFVGSGSAGMALACPSSPRWATPPTSTGR
jgi:hypothetical protein